MSDLSTAWLLAAGEELQLAMAQHEVMEYLSTPQLHFVPTTPVHSCNVIFWRDQIVPVVDLVELSGLGGNADHSGVAILAYQEFSKSPLMYVGLRVSTSPISIEVNDEDVCRWPEDGPELIGDLILTAFTHDGQTVGILNTSALCSTKFSEASMN